MQGVPRFVAGLQQLIEDDNLRVQLGQRGRQWVGSTHNGVQFLRAFDAISAGAGLRRARILL